MPQFVTFHLDQQRYALDILLCKEISTVQEVTPVPESPEHVLGLINLRGQILTVIDICGFMGSTKNKKLSAEKKLIILRTTTELKNRGIQTESQYRIKDPLAFVVDHFGDIVNVNELDICPPTTTFLEEEKQFVSGVIPLKNYLIAILSMDQILRQCLHLDEIVLPSLL